MYDEVDIGVRYFRQLICLSYETFGALPMLLSDDVVLSSCHMEMGICF